MRKEDTAPPPPVEEVAAVEEVEQETLESKIRKSRPPPRVRISSSSQPGYVSLRLDGVAVTFRNQEVVKDATWEVKTGDRIGLVGPNGGCIFVDRTWTQFHAKLSVDIKNDRVICLVPGTVFFLLCRLLPAVVS